MPSRHEQRPDTVVCGNRECSRPLGFSDYRYGYVHDDVKSASIHWRAYPLLDGDSVLCTCGHFTAYYDPAVRSPPAR